MGYNWGGVFWNVPQMLSAVAAGMSTPFLLDWMMEFLFHAYDTSIWGSSRMPLYDSIAQCSCIYRTRLLQTTRWEFPILIITLLTNNICSCISLLQLFQSLLLHHHSLLTYCCTPMPHMILILPPTIHNLIQHSLLPLLDPHHPPIHYSHEIQHNLREI